ncbi:MAG: cysteine hydrolase family protein [Candidatus Nezhaarchaeales archaeon]
MTFALLIIDMLNDFVRGSLKVPKAEDIIANIKKLIDIFHAHNMPVIYINDSHIKGVDQELKLWGDHAIEGSWGAQVVDELSPQQGDFIIKKRRYSGFFSTGLDLLLRELNVKTLVLTGLVTDICVQHTAADAFFRGYKVIIVSDATTALTPERHERALNYMKEVYGASISRTAEIEALISKPQP